MNGNKDKKIGGGEGGCNAKGDDKRKLKKKSGNSEEESFSLMEAKARYSYQSLSHWTPTVAKVIIF